MTEITQKEIDDSLREFLPKIEVGSFDDLLVYLKKNEHLETIEKFHQLNGKDFTVTKGFNKYYFEPIY